MEFPDLGQHCSLASCKQLDLLPINCDACNQVFCKDHFEYGKHNCEAVLLRDVKVPVCPLCQKPVPVGKGKNVDEEVSKHIDRDCQSDPAKEKRKAYSNRCSVKGCKQKELMKIICTDCRHNFCLRHRHPQDHECRGNQSASTSAATSAVTRNKKNASASSARNTTSSSSAGNKSHSSSHAAAVTSRPQRTLMSSMGSELNRMRQARLAQPQNMTEDEQMALALQRSLNENQPELTQEELDLQLAQQLQREEAARTRRRTEQQRRRREEESSSSCNIT